MSFTQTDGAVITERARQQLYSEVSLAAESVALNWPIRTFISRSPLAGYEHLPFREAVVQGRRLLGGEGYLSLADYRACWMRGRIKRNDLEWALKEVEPEAISDTSIQVGTKRIRACDVLLLHLVHGFEAIDATTFFWKVRNEQALTGFQRDVPAATRARLRDRSERRESEPRVITALWEAISAKLTLLSGDAHRKPDSFELPDQRQLLTVVELVDCLTGSTLLATVNDEMIKWLTAFTDEGLGDWSMPGRDRGFYEAWRDLGQHDATGWFLGIENFAKKLRALPDQAGNALSLLLQRLEVSNHERIDYCSRHLAHLHGWSGYIRWKSQQPGQLYVIDPVQYLTVRLFYEAELAASTYSASLNRPATLPQLRAALPERSANSGEPHDTMTETLSDHHVGDAWRLFVLAQHLAFTPADIRLLRDDDTRTLLEWLDSLPAETCRPVWQEAYEHRYRHDLLGRLRPPRTDDAPVPAQARPLAQAVFCIDVRSEPFRRYLEAQGAYDTIGFAGFFGIPLRYRALDHGEDLSLCPVLIKPKFSVYETPSSDHSVASEAHLRGSYWHEIGEHIFHRLKSNPLSSYMLVDLTGLLFAFVLVGKTVLLSLYHRLTSWAHRWLIPPVPTTVPVEKRHPAPTRLRPEHDESRLPQGFATQEQALVTENSLRIMGLTKNFARLVLICGHGSTTENNPYVSSYDCGACGGNHGGPNARVLACLANSSETRAALRARGITIPDDTVFLAAEHNTTTDQVNFFDLEDLPSSHYEEWRQLARDLERAGAAAATERCRRIPGASRFARTDLAADHVEARSFDWAQTRPEWGLSGNAAFIIGRRDLTRSVTLDGRVFLHNYDAATDESGKVLEAIMTAPLVVGEWINLQYYFSTVDSWTYGSGSKVLHNVVGGIGVMLGRHSDLQTGLPMQSVKDGARLYHEPMRLLAIIETTTERLSQIIGRQQVLRRFFNHRWVHLVAIDPVTGEQQEYRPGGQWVPVIAARASDEETR